MESHLQSILGYLSAHPSLALACVFAAALLEAVAVVGTVIPGSSFVFLGGVLAGLGILGLVPTAGAALVGAILGDGISYWLGHHYGARLVASWPLRDHPRLLERGRAYFQRNGGKSVFLGRFLGPVRAIVPVLAGMSGMNPLRFYTLNVLSAVAWAAAHLLPGWLFGASLELAGAVSSRLATLLIVLTVIVWALAKLLRYIFAWASPRLASARDRVVRAVRGRPGAVSHVIRSLLDPALPESHALLLLALLLVGGGWLFLGVLQDVVAHDPLVRFDESVHATLRTLRTHWGDRAMIFITELGGTVGLVPVIGAVSLLLVVKRYWRTLSYWLVASVFAEALVWMLKETLGRARPSTGYSGLQQFSFPSGHAALAIVVYGFLAFLVARHRSVGVQAAITVAAGLLIALIAFSRLYLGVHWFSDVMASIGLGLAWVAVLGIAYTQHVRNEPLRLAPTLGVTFTTLAVVGLAYVPIRVDEDVRLYASTDLLPSMTLHEWIEEGWRELPHARIEATGSAEEPLTVQWAADRKEIASTLRSAAWQPPAAWGSSALLQWIVPGAAVASLPVLPKFNQGEPPDLVWIKPLDAQHRLVLRLWDVYRVQEAHGTDTRLWIGMASEEKLHRLLHFFNYVTTSSDTDLPTNVLATQVMAQHYSLVAHDAGGSRLILVWFRGPKA